MRRFIMTLLLAATTLCSANEDNLELLISPNEISSKIQEVARQIDADYKDKQLTILITMKGALCVSTDLLRAITIPCKVEHLEASSYGYNGMKAGELTIARIDQLEIEGRDVLIVDDIFETGNTMVSILNKLESKKPNSMKTLLLLVKDIPRKTTYLPDYTLFTIEDRFVIGYGMDYQELYRGLPGVYAFIGDKAPF